MNTTKSMVNNMFKDESLQARMMKAFMFMGVLVMVVAFVGLITTLRLSVHINTFSGNTLPSIVGLWKINEGQTQIESSERALLITGLTPQERETELNRIKKAWEQIDDGFKQYEKTPRDAEEDRVYKKLQDNWSKWKSDHQEFLKLNQQFELLGIANPYAREQEILRTGKNNSPEIVTAKKAIDAFHQLRDRAKENRVSFEAATQSILEDVKINENTGIKADKEANEESRYSILWSIIVIIMGPIIAILLGRYLGNAVIDTLIQRLQQSVVKMTTSTTQIAASGRELEATVVEQLASTNEVTATTHEIAGTSIKLVKMIDNVAEMAQTTAVSANKSQEELAQMATVMRQLTKATISIASKLATVNEKAYNINNVVVTITKVADQTSLLSLNAAIEAEKAGEYGSGFAVVAREIRRLADQTAVATLEIEQIVKEILSAVSVSVMEMDKFKYSVNNSVKRVNKISNQIAKVINEVQSLPPQFEQVSQSIEQQSEGAQQISEAMEQLAQASHQTVDALRESNNALSELNDAAQGLRQEISTAK